MLNVEYWILNVKFKCYGGWVGFERLWIYFQVSGIRYFVSRGCADDDGLRAVFFGCSWLLLPKYGGTITSSGKNGINSYHCWMWNFWCIRLDLLMLPKFKGPRRVGGDLLYDGELISGGSSAHWIYLELLGVWLGQMITRWP